MIRDQPSPQPASPQLDLDRPVNTAKAARWLGVSMKAITKGCAAGRFPNAWHLGANTSWLIPLRDLKHYRPTPADKTLLAELLAREDL